MPSCKKTSNKNIVFCCRMQRSGHHLVAQGPTWILRIVVAWFAASLGNAPGHSGVGAP